MKFLMAVLGVTFAFALITPKVEARDMSSRLGIGISDQLGTNESLPSIAIRYWPNAQIGFAGSLGVDTKKDYSRFGIQGKIMKNIFPEEHMNFYAAAAASLISEEAAGKNSSGFSLAGMVGAEFFFQGLENLGFSFEGGVGITSISNQVRFRTIADHPLKAGLTFYF